MSSRGMISRKRTLLLHTVFPSLSPMEELLPTVSTVEPSFRVTVMGTFMAAMPSGMSS